MKNFKKIAVKFGKFAGAASAGAVIGYCAVKAVQYVAGKYGAGDAVASAV